MKNSLKSLSPHSFDYVRNLMFYSHIKLIKNSKIHSIKALNNKLPTTIKNVTANITL